MLVDGFEDTFDPSADEIGCGPVMLGAAAFLVESGALDVYLADPNRAGSRRHVLTIPAGEAFFQVPKSSGFVLLGFPATDGTRVRSLDVAALSQLLDAGDSRALGLAEAWIERMDRAFAAAGAGKTVDLIAPNRGGHLSEVFLAYEDRIALAIEARLRAEIAEAAVHVTEAPEKLRLLVLRPFLGLLARDRRSALADPKDPLASAFRQVAAANGITLADDVFDTCPPHGTATPADRLAAFARATKMRLRPVRLAPGWWRHGGQNLVVFAQADGLPLAALARTGWRHGYDLVTPDGTPWVQHHGAAHCSEYGYVVQRAFPDEPITGRGMLHFSARLAWPLAVPALIVALVICLLGLITPIGTEILFETVIPASSRSCSCSLSAASPGSASAPPCSSWCAAFSCCAWRRW